MSTRGMIARLVPGTTTLEGRYHHFDSYPRGLGRTLWHLYHDFFDRDIERMQQVLIDEHPAGWSTINDCDLSLPPGYVNHPGIEPYSTRSREDRADDAKRCQCYCHGDRSEAERIIRCHGDTCTGRECDPLFIEWVWLIGAEGLTVYASHNARPQEPFDALARDNGYRHRRIGSFSWGEAEPNWDALQEARG